MSKIEWTRATWNPVTGCKHVSRGCGNCYAETFTKRLQAMGQTKYAKGFDVVVTHPYTLIEPMKWKQPKLVFVCSMSDLFHVDVPTEFIQQVFEVMMNTPQHTYQVLTKRPERVLNLQQAGAITMPYNVWLGTSVESNQYLIHRTDILLKTKARIRFLSCEPLLGRLNAILDYCMAGIDWVIVGGESGVGARPMNAAWVNEIYDACEATDTLFFFKQWGGVRKGKAGRLLYGREHNGMPNHDPVAVGQPTLLNNIWFNSFNECWGK